MGMFSPEATPEPAQQSQYTPEQVIQYLQSLTPEQLSKMDFGTLMRARELATDRSQQNALAPYEHRAFTRQAVYDNPLMALPLGLGAVAYQPYKAYKGLSRSDPSMTQVTQGIAGVVDGLHNRIKEIAQSISYKDPFGDTTR